MTEPLTPAESLFNLQSRYERINDFKRQTRSEEAELWAEVYVWWDSVREPPDFLAQCYQQHNIGNYNTTGINFRPLLRLVSQNEITESNLNLWTRVLRFVHDDVQANPLHYQHDPIGAIKHFIQTNGGKTGLCCRKKLEELDSDDAPVEPLLFTLDESEFQPTYEASIEQYYPHAAAPVLQNQLPLKLTQDGYSLVWVKKAAQGVIIIGSSNDPAVLQQVALNHYRSDFEAAPTTVRSVLEPLQVLNVPRVIAHSEAKFIEKSKVDD